MKIQRIENIIGIVMILATVLLDKWYPYLETLIKEDSIFTILLKYILLYFLSAFMGDIVSIIYLFHKKRRNLFHAFDDVSGWKALVFILSLFIIIPIFGLNSIGLLYSLYIQMTKPYITAIVVIFFGVMNGFGIGGEKYYEETETVEKVLVKIKKNKRKVFKEEKPFDHSFNDMLSYFFVLFVIFFPMNYVIEKYIDNIAFTIVSSICLFLICYRIKNILYRNLFIHCELEHENDIFTSLLFFAYSFGTFIGFIYYDISVVKLIGGGMEFADMTLDSKIFLIIMTGYLPLRLIPMLFSLNHKLYEKIINILVVIIYMVRKFV